MASWIGGVVLLACLAFTQARAKLEEQSAADLPFAVLQAGDTLPDVLLADHVGDTASISRLFKGKCAVAHFFLSTCPACRHHAAKWSGMDSIQVGGRPYPIVWVGLMADTAAFSFMADYDLGGQLMLVRTLQEWTELGIYRTPMIYFLDQQILLANLPPAPSRIDTVSVACTY